MVTLAAAAVFTLLASGCGVEGGQGAPERAGRAAPLDVAAVSPDGESPVGSGQAVGSGASGDRDSAAPGDPSGDPEIAGADAGVKGEPPAADPVITRDAPQSARRPPPPPVEIPDPEERPVFERPEHVRGIYLNAWTAGSARRIESLLDLARRTEINAFVIDLKDASGYVSYATGVEEARRAGAAGEIRIRDLSGLLRRLEAEGVYPIARIVVVKDPILADARPELAVQDTAGGVWWDSKKIRWLNLFDERVVDYHLALAKEAVSLGFPEVQWDYIRFADAPRSDLARAVYPGREGRTQTAAVRAFLDRSRRELGEMDASVTADVFGVTTSAGDIGIGQVWEEFIDVVDAALPMVYPSHYYRGSFGVERPNARPYEIVKHAIGRAVARSAEVEGAGAVIPWLQDFSLGEPGYGPPEVRAQIQAVYDAGVHEWLLWNPGSRYTEEALRPVGGWGAEPLVRVADRVVPVSERMEALEWARARRLDSIAGERGEAAEPAGSPARDTSSSRRGGG